MYRDEGFLRQATMAEGVVAGSEADPTTRARRPAILWLSVTTWILPPFFGKIMNQENIPSTQHSLHPAHLVLHSAPECSQRLPSRYYPLIGTPQAPDPEIPV